MNIFEFAMQMEKDGEAYYRELAQKSPEKGLATILTMLAEDEVKHYQVLKEMSRKSNPKLIETNVLNDAKNVFRQIREQGKKFTFPGRHIDLYRKAQELEQKSEDFYREKAADVENPAHRDILTRIAEEEQRHYFLLDNIIEFISRPDTWLENAEFNHLDEY